MSNSDEILIVEDSQMQAKRLKKLLQENGFEVVAAHNGKEGLALARERRPALIVSDIVMPEMDGYEMCRSLKSDADLQKIPVILLTSLSNPDDVFKGLESGADSYVSKPYDAKVLIDRIRSVKESQSLQNSDSERMLQVRIGAKQYTISSTRQQILNLLLSTYQDAVEQNRILREMRTKLVTVNEELGILVAARTAALEKEKVERKRIEEALASEKERLSVTLRTIADGVITTNTEGTIILMNRAAEELTGWPLEEALGKSVTNIFNLIKTRTRESGELVVENILKSGGLIGFEQLSLVAKDGSERLVAVSGTPIFDMTNIILGIVLVFRDVTVAKRTEEELIKAQKLESLGVLAGGIAHDFNNLLTAILGNISLAKMFAKPGGKVIARLDEAEKASVRAKDLTQQLLTFAKGGAPLKKTTAIADVLRDSAKFALRGSNIKCRFSIPPDLWPVEIDEGQISQVIHNLTINAHQAMPNGGAILVSAENIEILPDQDPGTSVSSGKYVLLSIQDEGHGIPRHLLTRIFDPYFTTKKRGNGLGLATSYSILKNHGGTITVDSEIDAGSTFHIYLPVSLKREHPRKVERQRPIPGTGRILVMDDEEILRDFVGELLQLLGYDVSFACDGAETIAQYTNAKQTGNAFDCILMDLTIPGGMGGKETIQRLIDIDPAVKAIVSSGYSDDPIMADFGTYGFCGVVAKPYDAKELSEVLQRVLAIPN